MTTVAGAGRHIDGLTAGMSPRKAARIAVDARLSAVCRLLNIAAEHGGVEARPVHKLRVATRRARTALRVFSACLPAKRERAAARRLRKIRRAAGLTRACDVDADTLSRLYADAGPDRRDTLALLIGRLGAQRDGSFPAIVALASSTRHKLENDRRKLVKKTRDPEHGRSTLRDFASIALGEQLRRVDSAASGDLTDIDAVHALRIEVKRLRYTLETIRPGLDQSFVDEFYPMLEAAQDRFGAVNDSHELASRIARWSGEISSSPVGAPARILDDLAVFGDELERRSRDTHEQFLRWWPSSELRRFLAGAMPDELGPDASSHRAAGAAVLSETGEEDRA